MASGETGHTTALVMAVARGWLEAAQLLLDAGADPNLRCTGGTPLVAAAEGGQVHSPGQCCHSGLSLTVIGCHSLGIYTVILLSLLSSPVQMTARS
jgi:hypothetical protein